MTVVAGQMVSDPSSWSWAKELVSNYKQARTEVIKIYADNPFFQDMKVAALSAKELAKVKRDYKDSYLEKLVEFITTLGPRIESMAQSSYEIKKMADAKRSAWRLCKRIAPPPRNQRPRPRARLQSVPARTAASTSEAEGQRPGLAQLLGFGKQRMLPDHRGFEAF